MEAPHLVVLHQADQDPEGRDLVPLAVLEDWGGQATERDARLLDAGVIFGVRQQHIFEVAEKSKQVRIDFLFLRVWMPGHHTEDLLALHVYIVVQGRG